MPTHAHGFWVGMGGIVLFIGGHGSWEVLANLDHEKEDALAPPQKKLHIDDPTSMYAEFEDELEESYDIGVEIVVVSNLNARIELELSMYETYKVIDLGKNEIIAAVSSTLPTSRDTTFKFNILLWWRLKGAPTFPIMLRVARSVFVHPCIHASLHLAPNRSQTFRTHGIHQPRSAPGLSQR